WSTGMTTIRSSLSCPGSPAAPAPPARSGSRCRMCWPSGSASRRPRSLVSTWSAGGSTGAGPIGWQRLVLALGSRPNDFAIPGLAQRALSLYSAGDAEQVWAAVGNALTAAAAATDPGERRRLATVVVGGGGATGVELAGELAEILPAVASGHGLASG